MLAIAAACASGIVEAGIRGRLHRNAEIRFGPHLAIGSAVALIFGGSFVRAIVGG
jgi:prepilin signal peptidase PulO-like enzyme (type II secretory pathway)